MGQSSNKSNALWPFKGFGYFLKHPSLWLLPIIAVLVTSLILFAAFIIIVVVAWPAHVTGFWHHFWGILRAFGFGTAGVLIGFIVVMPTLILVALDKMVRKILLIEHGQVCDVTFFRSMYSGTIIFFKTIGWRIFWPVVGIISAIFFGPVGVFISQLGIGHLAVIDGVDLTLALRGKDTRTRIDAYKANRGSIFCVGFFSAILSMALSFTIIGWLIWIPSVFAGCALWVKDWP